jgi:hypothetical protein
MMTRSIAVLAVVSVAIAGVGWAMAAAHSRETAYVADAVEAHERSVTDAQRHDYSGATYWANRSVYWLDNAITAGVNASNDSSPVVTLKELGSGALSVSAIWALIERIGKALAQF